MPAQYVYRTDFKQFCGNTGNTESSVHSDTENSSVLFPAAKTSYCNNTSCLQHNSLQVVSELLERCLGDISLEERMPLIQTQERSPHDIEIGPHQHTKLLILTDFQVTVLVG